MSGTRSGEGHLQGEVLPRASLPREAPAEVGRLPRRRAGCPQAMEQGAQREALSHRPLQSCDLYVFLLLKSRTRDGKQVSCDVMLQTLVPGRPCGER